MYKKLSLFGYYSGSMFILLKLDSLFKTEDITKKDNNNRYTVNLKHRDFIELFNPNLIFSDKDQMLNISIPFNRDIKKIYDLDIYYVDYENYDFNKLSDLFLNIHIFIN